MSILFLKSLLSLIMVVAALIQMVTMFEILGRGEKKYDIAKLKRIHKIDGVIYLSLFFFIAYLCFDFIVSSKAELSPRGTLHSVFALTVLALVALKLAFIHLYRQFYGKVQTLGILIALITFGMVGTSGGYYLLVTEFGTDLSAVKKLEYKKQEKPVKEADKTEVRTDSESIAKGKELYEQKCYFCHDAHSTEWGVGPGHKGIMKNPYLPVSKRPATPENVANQIRNPYRDMPSFSYLSDEGILNLIAYLNTL